MPQPLKHYKEQLQRVLRGVCLPRLHSSTEFQAHVAAKRAKQLTRQQRLRLLGSLVKFLTVLGLLASLYFAYVAYARPHLQNLSFEAIKDQFPFTPYTGTPPLVYK